MLKRTVSGITLTLLLIGMLALAFSIQPVKGWTGTVYIRADGSIEPSDAPITTYDNITYTLTDSISSNGDGIVVERSNITINGNGYTLQGEISFDSRGIYLSGRENVTVKNTQIKSFYYGILLVSSDHNSISGNTMVDNANGIYIYSSSHNSIFRNDITMVLWAGFGNGTILYYSLNNTLARNKVTNNNVGIAFYWYAHNNSIIENDLTNNGASIFSYNSNDYNNIVGNNITDNECGVYLGWFSNYNTIRGNKITANTQNGVELMCASNNIIHHNNFTDNTKQVYDYAWDYLGVPPSINVWDDGYPSGGNYWSDYTGVDMCSGPYQDEIGSDGIGDTPYVIDENNQDDYPFMELWSPVPPTINATVDIIPNVLNLRAKPKYVNAFIELPEGYSVSEIDAYSILMNGTISVNQDARTVIGDYDSDGIPDLRVKFNGTEVIEYILANINMTKLIEERFMIATLTITGYLNDGTPFQGSDTIRIMMLMPRGGGRRSFLK